MNGFCNQKNRKGGCFAEKKITTTKIGCNVHIIITCSKLIPLFALWWNSIGLSLLPLVFAFWRICNEIQTQSHIVRKRQTNTHRNSCHSQSVCLLPANWLNGALQKKNQFQRSSRIPNSKITCSFHPYEYFHKKFTVFIFYNFFRVFVFFFFILVGFWNVDMTKNVNEKCVSFFCLHRVHIKRIMCIYFTMSFVCLLLLLMIADDMIFFIDKKRRSSRRKKRVPLQWTHIFPKKATLWVFRIKR